MIVCSGTSASPTRTWFAVDLLEIEVLHVEIAGGQSPGDGGVVADHHPGTEARLKPATS